jgi:hypothetical protein
MVVPSSGPSTKRGDAREEIDGRIDGAKALAVARKAIASANRVEAAMVRLLGELER